MQYPQLNSREDYIQRFTDTGYWKPYIEAVCQRHRLLPHKSIRHTEIPGTYPVFIVEDQWVIKFFGQLFDGHATFSTELAVNSLIVQDKQIPAPQLITHGRLFEEGTEWHWPYLVFQFVPGESLSQARYRVCAVEKMFVAKKLGRIVKHLHSLSLEGKTTLQPTWDNYINMLERQQFRCKRRHKEWNSMPSHMIDQINEFLLPIEELVDYNTTPSLLHGDLTADHVLGLPGEDGWNMFSIIDFGDAIVGDALFELIALHLDLFRCDRNLLGAFTESYELTEKLDKERALKLMNLCLLHPFNVFQGFFNRHPETRYLSSLDEFADWLWKIEPGGGPTNKCT